MSQVDKKKFTDRAVGKWIAKAAKVVPGVVDVVTGGRFSGAIEIVEGLLKDEPNNPEAQKLLQELELKREEFKVELLNHEQAMATIHAGDRDSARNREIETRKSGSTNWIQKALALIVVAGFLTLVFILLTGKANTVDPTLRDVLLVLVGALSGMVTGVYQYYFGSSSGSAFKNTLLQKQSNNQS